MTYINNMNLIEKMRIDVTRERTGFALPPESMTAAAYQADVQEALRRLEAKPMNHPDRWVGIDHDEVVIQSIDVAWSWSDLDLHALNCCAIEALEDADHMGAQEQIDRLIEHVRKRLEEGYLLPDMSTMTVQAEAGA